MVAWIWSEMTLNYKMIVKRCPKLNGVVGGSKPDPVIFSLLDRKTSQVVKRLVYSQIRKNIA